MSKPGVLIEYVLEKIRLYMKFQMEQDLSPLLGLKMSMVEQSTTIMASIGLFIQRINSYFTEKV